MRAMNIYRPDPHPLPLVRWILKRLETIIKLLPILGISFIPAALMCSIWFFCFERMGEHFLAKVSETVIISWVTFVGFLYSILTGVIVTQVASEYKAIRMAIKQNDIETFMSLRDEDVSPMIHAFMTVLALFAIATFMGFEYPDAFTGIGAVGASTYLFAFIYWIIREFDDPFYGFWFIKNIPEGWLDHDPKLWRQEYYSKTKVIEHSTQGTTLTKETVTTEVSNFPTPAAIADDE